MFWIITAFAFILGYRFKARQAKRFCKQINVNSDEVKEGAEVKKIKLTGIMFALAFMTIITPVKINAQQDIYDVVGATDTIENEENTDEASKKKVTTDVKADEKETSESVENSDVEDTKDILKDIRTMLLGILFACAWTAGAVTFGNFSSPFNKRV